MDNAQLKNILVPAVAVAAVIVVAGVLVGLGQFGDVGQLPKITSLVRDGSDAGMADTRPPLDAPEWKDVGDGLKAWDVAEGTGPEVASDSQVKAHYSGWLTDGTVFDSSRRKGTPFGFTPGGGVIKGWGMGVVGMKAGGVRRLYVPYALGYGDKDHRDQATGAVVIPARSDLVFEIKVLAVEKGQESGPPPDVSTDGMSATKPPADGPDWRDAGNGLKVWDVKEGTGPVCRAGASATMHYTGWLLSGAVFDSTLPALKPEKGGVPATFSLGDLVKGWQEGIPGMKPGGVRRLYVPYQLAYGEQGRPPAIPAKADLIFEIKLVASR